MLLVGRKLGWAAVVQLPQNFSLVGLNAWWVVLLAPVLALVSYDLLRTCFGLGLRAIRLPRAATTALAALLGGGLLSFGYYPALASQLSPREVFVRYAALHAPGEPLGVLGLGTRSVRYYAGRERIEPVTTAAAAQRWLNQPAGEGEPARRWLVLRAKDLPELNSLFRETRHENLPVLDASSGAILLASNELGRAKNANWLEAYVRSAPGFIQHPVTATFEGSIVALGWDVVDADGKLVDYVVPQRSYQLRFYYRVDQRVTKNYKGFVHVDGAQQRRHNADHDVVRGQYPVSLWRPGDVVMDDVELVLEPNFSPGRYTVFFGFFQGSNRFQVTDGPHQDNRVDGGALVVR
jgi:hypothetical protein